MVMAYTIVYEAVLIFPNVEICAQIIVDFSLATPCCTPMSWMPIFLSV